MADWDPPTDDELKEGNVVKASYHRRVRDETIAFADQEPGAPQLLIPEGLKTDENDSALVLSPDGSGGAKWQPVAAASQFVGVIAYRNTATGNFGGTGKLNFPDTTVDSSGYLVDSGDFTGLTKDRVRIPTGLGGIYSVSVKAECSASVRNAYLELNGTAYDGTNGGKLQFIDSEHNVAISGVEEFFRTWVCELDDGDYLEIFARGTTSVASWSAGGTIQLTFLGQS